MLVGQTAWIDRQVFCRSNSWSRYVVMLAGQTAGVGRQVCWLVKHRTFMFSLLVSVTFY